MTDDLELVDHLLLFFKLRAVLLGDVELLREPPHALRLLAERLGVGRRAQLRVGERGVERVGLLERLLEPPRRVLASPRGRRERKRGEEEHDAPTGECSEENTFVSRGSATRKEGNNKRRENLGGRRRGAAAAGMQAERARRPS